MKNQATSTSCPSPAMTSCTQAECVPTSITTRAGGKAWKNSASAACPVCKGPCLASRLANPKRSNGSIDPPNPLPLSAGPDWGSVQAADPLLLDSPALASIPVSSQFLHQFRQHFLGFSRYGVLSFRPLGFRSLLRGRIAILFQGSISLSIVIAPVECVDYGSLTRSVIGDRPSPSKTTAGSGGLSSFHRL
jgi:hypothetical protein